mmetsp:Transcript_18824/g.30842  ORF Transcript_18824/g.30842 Transcript_18824/m.30842 type:complete len:267 (-) Transcript_18824:420-1220(-)
MSAETVSFDEFQAALLEEKTSAEKMTEGKLLLEEKASTKNATMASASEHPTRLEHSRQTLAKIVERPSTQVITILFVYLDIIYGLLPGENPSTMWNTIFLVFFTCELVLQAALFYARFFSHWGCLVDTVLIAMRLGTEYTSLFEMNQQHLALLNFLRCWRFARLLNSLVATEKQKCTALKRKLKSQFESTNDWKERALLSEDIAKVCNEEVKTLREALIIASVDVAAAMLGKVNPELSHSINDDHERDELNDMQVVIEDSSTGNED